MSPMWTDEELVSLNVGGQRVLLAISREHAESGPPDDEEEIAAKPFSLEDVLTGLEKVATAMASRLRGTGASKVSVEFGCDVAVESGTLVAIIGKGSVNSSFRVGLEWQGPAA